MASSSFCRRTFGDENDNSEGEIRRISTSIVKAAVDTQMVHRSINPPAATAEPRWATSDGPRRDSRSSIQPSSTTKHDRPANAPYPGNGGDARAALRTSDLVVRKWLRGRGFALFARADALGHPINYLRMAMERHSADTAPALIGPSSTLAFHAMVCPGAV